jgi:hypothetical protein
VSGTLPAGSAVLVRKLARKRHWGSSDQSAEQRTAEVLSSVFLNDDKPYSLYRVSSESELDRIALALNAGRSSLSEECFFTYFTEAELQAAAISLTQTAGQTPCHHANHLHFDADAAEAQLVSLITNVLASGRDLVRRGKSQMKLVAEQAAKDQCLAAVANSPECKAHGCPKP